jgi:hypothetical protein
MVEYETGLSATCFELFIIGSLFSFSSIIPCLDIYPCTGDVAAVVA